MTGAHPEPTWVPEGARAVVRAWPHRSPHDPAKLWFLYDVWSADTRRWTERLTFPDARDALEAEGYRRNRAQNLMGQARRKVRAMIGNGSWRGSLPEWKAP